MRWHRTSKTGTKTGQQTVNRLATLSTLADICHYLQTSALRLYAFPVFPCSAETCTALIADLCTARSARVGDRTRYNNLCRKSQLNQCRNHCADIGLRSQLLSWPINTGLSWRMNVATVSHQPLVPKKCFCNLIIKQCNYAFIGRLPSKISIWLQVFWNSIPLTLQVPRNNIEKNMTGQYIHAQRLVGRLSCPMSAMQ